MSAFLKTLHFNESWRNLVGTQQNRSKILSNTDTQRQEMIMGLNYCKWWAFYFVENYILYWIQHSYKMKRGPLAREEKMQKFGNS